MLKCTEFEFVWSYLQKNNYFRLQFFENVKKDFRKNVVDGRKKVTFDDENHNFEKTG